MRVTPVRVLLAVVLVAGLAVALRIAPAGAVSAAGAGFVLLTLALTGSGSVAATLLPPGARGFPRAALSLLLGWGLLGTVLAFLGFGAFLGTGLLLVILSLLAAVGATALLGLITGRPRMPAYRPPSVWGAVALLVGLGLLAAVTLLRPPVTVDALTSAAALPRQWAFDGEIWGRPVHHGSLAPSLHLAWRATAEVLGGNRLAGLAGLMEIFVLCLGTSLAVRSVLIRGWAAALLACTFILALPLGVLAALERSGAPAATGLALGSLAALTGALEDEEVGPFPRGWAAVGGLLLGCALACGWAALPLAAGALAGGVLLAPAPGVGRAERSSLALLLALVPLTPWLARAGFLTGNPLYPWLMGGDAWQGPRFPPPSLPTAPDPVAWILGSPENLLVLGPLALLLIPLAAASPFLGERTGPLLVALGVSLVGCLLYPNPWWALGPLALLTALASCAAARLRRREPRSGKMFLATLILCAAVQVLPWLHHLRAAEHGLLPPVPTAVLAGSPDLDWIFEARRAAPPGARLLVVGETRIWPLESPAVWGTERDVAPVTHLLREAGESPDGLAFRAVLRRHDITHLLVSPQGAARLDAHGHFAEQGDQRWAALFRWLADPVQEWADARGNALWRLRTPEPTASASREP